MTLRERLAALAVEWRKSAEWQAGRGTPTGDNAAGILDGCADELEELRFAGEWRLNRDDVAHAAYRETVVAWLRTTEASEPLVVKFARWAADRIERGEPEAWAKRQG